MESALTLEEDTTKVPPFTQDGKVLVAIKGPEKFQFEAAYLFSVGGE